MKLVFWLFDAAAYVNQSGILKNTFWYTAGIDGCGCYRDGVGLPSDSN